jgi:hypothetical protein
MTDRFSDQAGSVTITNRSHAGRDTIRQRRQWPSTVNFAADVRVPYRMELAELIRR